MFSRQPSLAYLRTVMVAFLATGYLAVSLPSQTTLVVPSPSYPTIQSAIGAAQLGDTVSVAAGTYVENIDFLGKTITVRGQGPGVSIIDGNRAGPVVTFENNEGPGTLLEGFTIRNGLGRLLAPGGFFPEHYGGGIFIRGQLFATSVFPVICPTIRNCEITNNLAARGSAVMGLTWLHLTLESCDIHDNSTIDPLVIKLFPTGPTIYGNQEASIVMRGCSNRRNTTESVSGISGFNRGTAISDCVFEGNAATIGGPVVITSLRRFRASLLKRCVFRNNIGGLTDGGALYADGVLIDCIITGNSAARGAGVYAAGNLEIINCTIADNVATNQAGGIYLQDVSTVNVRNSIVWNNTPNQWFPQTNNFTLTASYSDFQGGIAAPGPGMIDVDPLFVDAANGDYHLRVDSPCVDTAGVRTDVAGPAADLDGDPRPTFAAIDMGADEVADIALHPSIAGTVGATSGGPFDVLLVDGDAGGPDRRVEVTAGQPFTVWMMRPPTNPAPARFAIYGVLAIPRLTDPVPLGGSVGTMAFPPCPLLPQAQPFLFTLTNNFGLDPCGQLVASTPAPWTSTPLPGGPAGFALTIQGVIEETTGVHRVTNGVIVVVQ